MAWIKKFFGHLKTVLKHKWWVFYYCCKAGIPWQGLVHDLSKFHPVEFFESVKYYSGTRSPIDACKEQNGYSAAWMHHKGRNKHHYEYWMDNFDHGGIAIEMPYEYTIEMLCDNLGASRAYNGKDFSMDKVLEWWENKKEHCAMHDFQKEFMDRALQLIKDDKSFNADSLCLLYVLLKKKDEISEAFKELRGE